MRWYVRRIRHAVRRRRLECPLLPCRRCAVAGRITEASRRQWHDARYLERDARTGLALLAMVGVSLLVAGAVAGCS